MKLNMGSWDRIIRLLVTLLVVILIITKMLVGAWAVVLGIIAIIFFVTGITGFCPLYIILGVSTKKRVP